MNFSGGLIAFYIVLKSLGLINTFGVYVIPSMLNLFFLLIAISFFREIPDELGESARIDGASELRIFISIVVPVSMPLMATMSLFIGSGQWNSWLDSAYFVQNENLRTLTYRMMQVINQSMVPTGMPQRLRCPELRLLPSLFRRRQWWCLLFQFSGSIRFCKSTLFRG